jgi:hypothetical protein
MSIQDDIFDVEDALKDKPEYEQFERVVTYLGNLERNLEVYNSFYRAAVDLRVAIQKIEKQK